MLIQDHIRTMQKDSHLHESADSFGRVVSILETAPINVVRYIPGEDNEQLFASQSKPELSTKKPLVETVMQHGDNANA